MELARASRASRNCVPRLRASTSGGTSGTSITGTGHISSLQLHFRTGTSLSKKKNTKKQGDADEVLASDEWKPKLGQWYHVLQETRGEEVVVQIEGGPTLIAKHPRFATAKTWLSLSTWGSGGTVSYDDVQIWKAEPKRKS